MSDPWDDPGGPVGPPPLAEAPGSGPKALGVPPKEMPPGGQFQVPPPTPSIGIPSPFGGGKFSAKWSSPDPTYYSGHEWVIANWDSDDVWQLQSMLARAGLLSGNITRGVPDTNTISAYRRLLELSNARGSDAYTTIGELLSQDSPDQGRWRVDEMGNLVRAGSGGQGPPPLVTQQSDPASLRRIFRRAVIDTLGEGWSEDKINEMVAAYHGVERTAQQQAHSAQISPTGGSFTAPPDPETFALERARAEDPTGAQAHEALGFADQFLSAVTSPSWGA